MAYGFVKITPQASTGTTSPFTFTFTGGNTTGNLIVVFIDVTQSNVDEISGITDTEGNIYTKSLASNTNLDGSGSSSYHSIWTAPVTNGSGSNNALSIAWTPGTRLRGMAVEYSGLSNSLDASNHGGGAVNTISYNITAANAGEAIITFCTQQSGTVNWSALSGTSRVASLLAVNNILFDTPSLSGSNTVSSFVSAIGQHSSAIALFLTPSTFSISGNAGIAGANVAYSGTASGNVTADGSGNYTISGLSNGNYTITPSLSGYVFSPTSQNETVSGSNITGVNFTASVLSVYSQPDCRIFGNFPNASRNVQGTLTYDVQTSSNPAIPSTDSRVSKPVDSRIAAIIPENSRTPGTVSGPAKIRTNKNV